MRRARAGAARSRRRGRRGVSALRREFVLFDWVRARLTEAAGDYFKRRAVKADLDLAFLRTIRGVKVLFEAADQLNQKIAAALRIDTKLFRRQVCADEIRHFAGVFTDAREPHFVALWGVHHRSPFAVVFELTVSLFNLKLGNFAPFFSSSTAFRRAGELHLLRRLRRLTFSSALLRHHVQHLGVLLDCPAHEVILGRASLKGDCLVGHD